MNRLFSILLCTLISTSLWAQDEHEAARKFAETINPSDFKAHISFLADDLLEGRETGKRGQVMAAHYIRTHFMRIGLTPGGENGSYYQEYTIRRTKAQKGKMGFGGKLHDHGDAYFSTKLPENVDGDWVFAGFGMHDEGYDNYIGVDVKGKNTLVFGGTPESPMTINRETLGQWNDRITVARSKGVKSLWMIVPDDWVSRLVRFAGAQASYDSGEENPMSIFYIGEAMANDLLSKAKSNIGKLQKGIDEEGQVSKLKFKKLNISYEKSADEDVFIPTNVLGFLEGTDKKEEVIVITGHYDHVGISRTGEVNNGADDDASGTTGVLEVAEAFALAAQNGHRPRRSILFMTVSGEEKGLLGSAYYADNPIYPVENTVVNLNMDMIGRIDPTYQERADSANYIYVIGSDKLSTDLHEIGEWANKTFTNLTLDYTYNDDNDPNRFYYRSDHYNFAKKGIPIIFYFNGTHADYHRPTDDIEKINFEKATKIARLAFHTAWEVANREERIKVDKEVK